MARHCHTQPRRQHPARPTERGAPAGCSAARRCRARVRTIARRAGSAARHARMAVVHVPWPMVIWLNTSRCRGQAAVQPSLYRVYGVLRSHHAWPPQVCVLRCTMQPTDNSVLKLNALHGPLLHDPTAPCTSATACTCRIVSAGMTPRRRSGGACASLTAGMSGQSRIMTHVTAWASCEWFVGSLPSPACIGRYISVIRMLGSAAHATNDRPHTHAPVVVVFAFLLVCLCDWVNTVNILLLAAWYPAEHHAIIKAAHLGCYL